jgi:hypothetical protein
VLKVYILKLGGYNWNTVESLGNFVALCGPNPRDAVHVFDGVHGAHLLVFCIVFFILSVFVLCLLCLVSPVSCVSNIASVPGMSILDYPFGFH